ncbi:MAG: transglycosylase SLT domain-containing protein [Lautropia sp.]
MTRNVPGAAPQSPSPAGAADAPASSGLPQIASPSTAEPQTIEALLAAQPAPVVKTDLWDRIRRGFGMPALDTPLVAQKKRFYLSQPDYLQRMFVRGSRYLHYIVEEVERRGMPTELALLPFVESAMNPVALSSAQAAGLWQFIPSTGKAYDLSQNWWVDNRRDVVQSTNAALNYLQKIYEMHGNDWFLALASYNWGEGAVARAVRTNRARGRPTDYLHLNMPTETRHYVPKLIALKQILLEADQLGVALPALPDAPYFVTVDKTRPIDLALAAQFADMSVEEFVALNPAHNRPVIAASQNNVLKIPADKLDGFMEAIARHEADEKVFATWQPYTLKGGDSLESVAARGNVSVAELRRANSIAPSVKVLAGTRILAPFRSVEDESRVERFAGARIYQQVQVPPVYHTVRKRESATTIARRYGLTAKQLAAFNPGVKQYRVGSRLLVRSAHTQTVLVTETGTRELVRAQQGGGFIKVSAPVRQVAAPAAQPVKRKVATKRKGSIDRPTAKTGTKPKARRNTRRRAPARRVRSASPAPARAARP